MSDRNAHWLDKWGLASGAQTLDFLDGIRGLAILMVVASHTFYVNPAAPAWQQFVGGVMGAGASGVTVFFALSGYLIALPFWKRKLAGKNGMPEGYFRRSSGRSTLLWRSRSCCCCLCISPCAERPPSICLSPCNGGADLHG